MGETYSAPGSAPGCLHCTHPFTLQGHHILGETYSVPVSTPGCLHCTHPFTPQGLHLLGESILLLSRPLTIFTALTPLPHRVFTSWVRVFCSCLNPWLSSLHSPIYPQGLHILGESILLLSRPLAVFTALTPLPHRVFTSWVRLVLLLFPWWQQLLHNISTLRHFTLSQH